MDEQVLGGGVGLRPLTYRQGGLLSTATQQRPSYHHHAYRDIIQSIIIKVQKAYVLIYTSNRLGRDYQLILHEGEIRRTNS